MDYLDPKFDGWLDEHEAEAARVKRAGDYRERQASDLLMNINMARLFVTRARSAPEADFSQLESLVEKIKQLRTKIGK